MKTDLQLVPGGLLFTPDMVPFGVEKAPFYYTAFKNKVPPGLKTVWQIMMFTTTTATGPISRAVAPTVVLTGALICRPRPSVLIPTEILFVVGEKLQHPGSKNKALAPPRIA